MAGAKGAVLVIGPSWVGDMVMAQTLFKALQLQQPGVAIDVAAPAWAAGILERMPEVRRAIPVPFGHGQARLVARWRFGRALRGQYAQAFVLPGSWKSALVPFAARIPLRSGYLKEQRWGLLNRVVAMPRGYGKKTAVTYQGLADTRVFDERTRRLMPALAVDENNQSRLFGMHGLSRSSYAVLMPGAEYGPAKRWPARHFAALAAEIAASGVRPVLVGSANDADAAAAIVGLEPAVLDLTGKTTLADAVDLAAGARFAIANDSGLMHIAAAVGIPVFGLFGSTSAQHTPPLSDRAEAISLHLSCSPCGERICPLQHHNCLGQLSPKLVAERLNRHRLLDS